MSEKSQKLKCQDCGQEFAFSAGEQKFYEEKGFEPPKRCPQCRKKRKSPGGSHQDERRPQEGLHTIKCAQCKKTSQVPFRPRSNKPVYCAECFEKKQDKS